MQSLKGKIDISVWDRAILILKKSEVDFYDDGFKRVKFMIGYLQSVA